MPRLDDFITFNEPRLKKKYEGRKMPMGALIEGYADGKIDIHGDAVEMMKNRWEYIDFQLTMDQWQYLLTGTIPDVLWHSVARDKEQVSGVYDRGDDFYTAFLDPRMVFTSGYFVSPEDSVEKAQFQKVDLVCRKLHLQPGERFLDIGCGWGGLINHAADRYGADATGITLSTNQAAWGNRVANEGGYNERCRASITDYRDLKVETPFHKIASLEMAEHVGLKNYPSYLQTVQRLLADDGLFFLQVVGPRKGGRKTMPAWGVFMNKYIFPGADGSLPLGKVVQLLEDGGFEVHSVENVNVHYGYTIRRWHENWIQNRDRIVAAHGERWYRIWHIFLAWATWVGVDGEGNCYQFVLHKASNQFARSRFVGRPSLAAPIYHPANHPPMLAGHEKEAK